MMRAQHDRYKVALFLSVMMMFLLSGPTSTVWACRVLEPPADSGHVFFVHLEGLCLAGDQRELAIKGADVLDALQAGKDVDVQGALVIGDVMLDQLPLQPLGEISHIPQPIQDHLQQRGVEHIRIIPGAITIRDSQFEHVVATNSVNEVLVILGEVHISGTTFLQSVDFSQIIFAKSFVFSHVDVEHEGFFIGAEFEETVDFSHTTFGTHSRFHKAMFRRAVSFANVEFEGVAEFLEVQFEGAVDFSHVDFSSGTGFSGSVFHGPADFSGVQTTQEIYFRFSEFKQDVSFRNGTFRSVVDFANSRFDGKHDFSEGAFAIQPNFTASNISVDVPISGRGFNRKVQWFIFGALFLFAGIYLWITKRSAG